MWVSDNHKIGSYWCEPFIHLSHSIEHYCGSFQHSTDRNSFNIPESDSAMSPMHCITRIRQLVDERLVRYIEPIAPTNQSGEQV